MNTSDFIPESKLRRASKKAYRKPDSIRQFEKQYQAWHYKGRKFPTEWQVKPNFRDDSANELTKIVCAWLKLNGYFAARVNTTGTFNAKLGKFIKSGSSNGMADVTSVINSKHVSIEIKAGRDKPRPEQLKVQGQVQNAGGAYIFIHSFDDFLEQIKNFI